MSFVRFVRYCVCITLLLNIIVPQRALFGQSDTTTSSGEQSTATSTSAILSRSELYEQYFDHQVELFLADMSVEDKIGQLFVVTFEGSNIGLDSDIADLINQGRVGGVVLSPRNGNISNSIQLKTHEAIGQVAQIANGLQALSYGYSWEAEYETEQDSEDVDELSVELTSVITRIAEITSPVSIPLFIAVEQAGDGQSKLGLPDTSLRRGFTELPSQLAIGATWDLDLSRDIGSVVGKELSAVGINMLLGPYLDVLKQPRTDKAGSLGIYSFGGDPFWVSRMGRAYIEGVHTGSDGQVLSVARHFPGQGDTDRLPFEEIASITSDAQTLERTHLPPFTAVTSNITGTSAPPFADIAITDAIMSSHMHFEGLQGDSIDGLTPFGFSSELLNTLEDFSDWRTDGLMMTSELGVPAIRKNYTPADGAFPYLGLARDAFLAGHDLIYLSYYGSETDEDIDASQDEGEVKSAKDNIMDVIELFRTQYELPDEGAFRERVDQSVKRILKAKLRLYDADQAFFAVLSEAQETAAQEALTTVLTTTLSTPLTTTLIATGTEEITSSLAPTNSDVTTPELDITNQITSSIQPLTDNGIEAADLVVPPSIRDMDTLSVTLTISIPLSSVLIGESPLTTFIGQSKQRSSDIVNQVAEQSLTLLFPQLTGELAQLPPQPQSDEDIVIFTDNHLVQECAQCIPENLVNPDAIESIIDQRYGEEATQQISLSQVKSFTFTELDGLLRRASDESPQSDSTATADNGESQTPSEIEADPDSNDGSADGTEQPAQDAENATSFEGSEVLEQKIIDEAEWIIFAMLDIAEERESSGVVKTFLNERGEQLRDKKLVVLALNAPYYLDATEMRRLNAYYGVNSKIRPFLTTAVRTLFKDTSLQSVPPGSSPVSAPGTRFDDLAYQLLPNPNRQIPIEIWQDDELIALHKPDSEENITEGAVVSSESDLTLRAMDIRDSNGNIVKDRTPVTFEIKSDDGASLFPDETESTLIGEAERTISLEKLQPQGGTLTIFASTVVDVENEVAAQSEVITILVAPMEQPATEATESTDSATPAVEAPTVDETPTGDTSVAPDPPAVSEKNHVDWFTLLISLVTILGMVSLLVILQERILPRQYLVRNILWAIVVGLLVYVLYGLLLPVELGKLGYPWAPPLAVFVAMLVPLLWLQLRQDSQ